MASMLLPELVEEILLRIPPDEPAHLVRAALICKPWRHILCDDGFLRRYRRFHGSPPLLGYIHNAYHIIAKGAIARLVHTSSPPSPVFAPPLDCSSTWWALDCRHGRVLVLTTAGATERLVVWEPITAGQQNVSMPPYPYTEYNMAAVLCATDGCDHLDCHGGSFLVVFLGTNSDDDDVYVYFTWVSVYSSKTGAWGASTSIDTHDFFILEKPSLLIGDALYFTVADSNSTILSILKYDLCRHELCVVSMPGDSRVFDMSRESTTSLMKLEDGGLGVVTLLDNCIYIWSRPDSIGGWVKHSVMELGMLLPQQPCPGKVISIAEGTYTIFISMSLGIFTLDLKSRKERKVGERYANSPILPYLSFYTPRWLPS